MIVLKPVETVGEPVVLTLGVTVMMLSVVSVLVVGTVAVAVTVIVLVLPPGLTVGVVLLKTPVMKVPVVFTPGG